MDGKPTPITTEEIFAGKKVVLFSVPGAFTPTCSQQHCPGFGQSAKKLKDNGIDTVACVSVNDVFVMHAWGEHLNVTDKILMLGSSNYFTSLCHILNSIFIF